MSLFPWKDDALALADIDAVRARCGVAEGPWNAWRILSWVADGGGSTCECHSLELSAESAAWKPSFRTDSGAQSGLVSRLSTRISWTRSGGNCEDWKGEEPCASETTPTAPTVVPATGSGCHMSHMSDQSDESEFAVDTVGTADYCCQRYVLTMGAPPQEEEASVEQLSAAQVSAQP